MLADSSDIFCTPDMCTSGDVSIAQMDNVYQSLPANIQPTFQSAHDSIISSYNAVASSLYDWIPFNTHCCTQQQIGQQADSLTSQMQTAMGQTPTTPISQQKGMSLQSMIVLGALGYLVFVYLASHH